MLKFNNEFTIKNLGEEVLFKGWVNTVRNLGGLLFIDLRDRLGIIQIVVKPDNSFYSLAEKLRNEDVIEIVGKIVKREKINLKIKNGDIEVELDSLKILAKSKELPYDLKNENTYEDTRLKYRYLDLRSEKMKNNLMLRHKIINIIRNYLDELAFIEVETPILTKSTPEGARDYLVPSRVHPGNFYALPQSPQLFKQLLMIGGIERYYQIARCFRDEDLRSDRQPEFTQLDLELSFIDEQDIIELVENLFKKLFKEILNLTISEEFEKISYQEAIELYGSDKPDLRINIKIEDIKEIFEKTNFSLFKTKHTINCLRIKEIVSRKKQEEFIEYVKIYGLNNLYFVNFENGELKGSIVKNLADVEIKQLIDKLDLIENQTIIIAIDQKEKTKKGLGALRLKLGKDYDLIEVGYKPLWVVNFPLFDYSEVEKRYVASHHPFTAPLEPEYVYDNKPEKCVARAYDFVINGYEVGGGSIRINSPELQDAMFKILGLKEKEIKEKFGFLIEAFNYGVPPHGGIAFGLERIVMLFAETDNIKDVIAFPKTASATCLMTDAPNQVAEEQLEALHLKSVKKR